MNSVLVLPEHRLRDVDWVPGITVVSANPAESLPHHLLQIDAEALGRALDGEASRHPAATVLLAVVRRSVAQGIPIRLGMIPQWLLESSAALEVAVRQACHQPDNPRGLRVAPLPRDVQWLQAAGPAAFRLVGFTGEVLVFDHRHTASPELCQLAKSHFASQLLRIRPSSGGEVWLQADGPARILSKRGRWRSFRTLRIHRELLAPVSAHAEVVRRPVLATRRIHALYPGSIDQANYWTEVIRAFSEVAGHTPEAVPILLVGSSCSRKLVELLGTGLDEIGWGEVRPAHRSRREHLLRAARNHWALVDVLDQWPQWQAIAQLAGVTLLPVVEALPIEQWYAARLAQSSESVEADAESEVEETHLLEALALAQLEDEGDGADESAETDEVNEALEVAAVAVNFIPTTDKPAAVWPVDLGQC